MGDDAAAVLLAILLAASPATRPQSPSSRPKGDGDKCKALPYAQLLSQVRSDSVAVAADLVEDGCASEPMDGEDDRREDPGQSGVRAAVSC